MISRDGNFAYPSGLSITAAVCAPEVHSGGRGSEDARLAGDILGGIGWSGVRHDVCPVLVRVDIWVSENQLLSTQYDAQVTRDNGLLTLIEGLSWTFSPTGRLIHWACGGILGPTTESPWAMVSMSVGPIPAEKSRRGDPKEPPERITRPLGVTGMKPLGPRLVSLV